MEKMTSIVFTCPGCERNFEFDHVGEYQLVPCPMCGVDYITMRKGNKLQLETLEFNQTETCLFGLSEVVIVES